MMRTHTCGALRGADDGARVALCGWLQNRRDHGGLLFIDLRDRYGVTQVVVEPDADEPTRSAADRARLEWVVRVEGVVRRRPGEQANAERRTGEIEVVATSFEVLNAADPLPIAVVGKERSSEDLALRYRYLDMRRPELRDALIARARINTVLRDEMIRQDFVEVETPSLLKSTPEGARDYLVPSRVHPGTFYALLQSPQILKQLTMIGGLDRYWQIVRCFRDEDLRADRQPEFTQLDVEMSFVTMEDVLGVAERLVHRLIREVTGVDVPLPFPRLSYDEAMLRYGSDKPDLRFELLVHDVSEIVRASSFGVFRGAVEAGGVVRALAVPAAHPMTRKEIDALPAVVADRGARGVAWCRVAGGEWSGSAAKFLSEAERAALTTATGLEDGGLLLFLAGPAHVAAPAAGDLRNHLARAFGLIRPNTFAPCWIVGFPLFEQDPATGALSPAHHAFTAPVPEDIPLLDTDPASVRAQAYDVAVNGFELLGGSIRIHRPDLQEKVLEVIGMGHDEAHARFGFLLEALRYGAPPHGGFAMGTDRLVSILLGLSQIRDVIAFPKTTSATDLMTGAPSPVDAEQLDELGLRFVEPQA